MVCYTVADLFCIGVSPTDFAVSLNLQNIVMGLFHIAK